MLIKRTRFLKYFDWTSFGLMILLLAFGLTFVFSSTYSANIPFSPFFKKQLFGVVTGLIIYALACSFNQNNLALLCFIGYFGALSLLVYTLAIGKIIGGGQRWISLGFIRFQPSELAKLLFPISFGYFLEVQSQTSRVLTYGQSYKHLIMPSIMLFSGFFLILKQPDLGTALVLLSVGLALFWISGVPTKFFIFSSLILCLCAPFLWKNLHQYQQRRVLVMLGYGEANKDRYQVEQAKIAVGSGKFFGNGFLKGTQNKLSFLPEDHNDFIFAVICEELGLFGVALLFLIFWVFSVRLLILASSLENLREQIIVTGLTLNIIISFIVNTGMVVGLLPVVGIPLPLFSYGVTNLWTTLFGLGVINGIFIRRYYQ
jgi:rod shape determining protein RodA